MSILTKIINQSDYSPGRVKRYYLKKKYSFNLYYVTRFRKTKENRHISKFLYSDEYNKVQKNMKNENYTRKATQKEKKKWIPQEEK